MRNLLIILCFLIAAKNYAQNQPPSAEEIRQVIAGEIYAFKIPSEKVFKVENKAVWNGADSIQIRIYYPKADKHQPIIFNIHGGALVACDLNTHDNICRVLCNKTQSIIIALDYKKPPEAPYPASLNDCETVLKWIKKSAISFGGNPNKLTVVGDSSGGLLITALMIKTQNTDHVKCIALINPAVDLREPGGGLYRLVTRWYLNGVSANDSLVSPITATNFSFFPPTLIITCEKDELKPHGIALYNKLIQANINAKTIDIPKQDHLGGVWAAAHPDAKLAVDETVKFIADNLKE